MIVFDASVLVGAALKTGSVPDRAFAHAELCDTFALSDAVEAEIVHVLCRPKFAGAITEDRRNCILDVLRKRGAHFVPTLVVADCRDAKDNKYLELALAARAGMIVSSDNDLLVLDPWRGVRILRPADYLMMAE